MGRFYWSERSDWWRWAAVLVRSTLGSASRSGRVLFAVSTVSQWTRFADAGRRRRVGPSIAGGRAIATAAGMMGGCKGQFAIGRFAVASCLRLGVGAGRSWSPGVFSNVLATSGHWRRELRAVTTSFSSLMHSPPRSSHRKLSSSVPTSLSLFKKAAKVLLWAGLESQ